MDGILSSLSLLSDGQFLAEVCCSTVRQWRFGETGAADVDEVDCGETWPQQAPPGGLEYLNDGGGGGGGNSALELRLGAPTDTQLA